MGHAARWHPGCVGDGTEHHRREGAAAHHIHADEQTTKSLPRQAPPWFCSTALRISKGEKTMATIPYGYRYRSPFSEWDAKATVRSSPRRSLHHEESKQYFTPELVPIAQHPEVVERGLSDTVQVEALYTY